ncbi:alpha/beta-hydrolase [Hyaloscypha variabilis]
MKPSIVLFLTVATVALADSLEQRQSNWTVGQIVQTDSGPVSGHAALNASQVSEYLGIPFAAPPVGDLRFAAPQKYTGNSSINGTSFGFSCPAATISGTPSEANLASANITASGLQVLEALAQFGDKFSEDCLTLNVWTKPQTGEAKKAVLLWIYGGGFTTGNSDNPSYNGQFIADQEDVVVVSINYRLNIFGFPGSPNATNNLGLLDQRFAVEWVSNNIASFGGDPTRITLFGQSAGGASVDYYSYAWTADPIVAGFIPESGTAIGLGQTSANQSAALWYNVSAKLDCGDASSDGATVLACMRTKNYTDILKALPSSTVTGSTGFGPTIDDVVVFSDYIARSTAGNFIKKPMLVGNANNEVGLFRAIAAVEGQVGIFTEAYDTAFNLLVFTCPAATRANISVANGVPTWRYRWFGEFPNTIITTVPDSGAWHASELPILFDYTPPSGLGIPASTPAEIAIGSYLRGAWATFAKDPVNGLKTYSGGNGTGWPTYNPGEDTLVRLAFQNLTGPNLALPEIYDSNCTSDFLVPASALVNVSTSSTATGTAPTATAKKSAGGRTETGLGLFVFLGALAIAL